MKTIHLYFNKSQNQRFNKRVKTVQAITTDSELLSIQHPLYLSVHTHFFTSPPLHSWIWFKWVLAQLQSHCCCCCFYHHWWWLVQFPQVFQRGEICLLMALESLLLWGGYLCCWTLFVWMGFLIDLCFGVL